MSAPDPARLSRRTALLWLVGGTAGVGALSACTPPWEDSAPASGRPSAAASRDAAPPSDDEYDVELADRALAAIATARTLADATGRRHVGLSGPCRQLVAMHRQHDGLLRTAASTDSPATRRPAVARRSALALSELRAAEEQCRVQLARFAGEARSGVFARVLASMSAGVAQQLALLPTPERSPA